MWIWEWNDGRTVKFNEMQKEVVFKLMSQQHTLQKEVNELKAHIWNLEKTSKAPTTR
jgi:hypothetical protein